MIYQNVELHNVGEVTGVAGGEGVRLQRVPESVRLGLEAPAQQQVLSPACCEIRFVCEGTAKVTLSSEGGTQVCLFFGDFQHPQKFNVGSEPQTIEIAPHGRVLEAIGRLPGKLAFSPRVRRLILAGSPVRFHSAEGDGLRPPTSDELPSLRLLTYGTSITHGAYASHPHLTYAAQTARHLHADLINLGVSGACLCEPAFANHIAARTDWHVASLAVSVNMYGRGFSIPEFYDRVSYLVNTVAGSDTSRPVACITLWPYFADLGAGFDNGDPQRTCEHFRQALRDAVTACPHPNAHLLEGPELFGEFAGLSTDMIHPGDYGMIRMGENLGARLAKLLSQ